jgi:hypothetical protein
VSTGLILGVEVHVVSWRAVSFQSQETLLAFIAPVLREARSNAAQGACDVS